MNVALVIAVVLLLSLGQLLFKRAGMAIKGRLTVSDVIWTLAQLPSFYVSLAIYGVATVLWIFVLSRMPLSIAYPWMAGAMVIVPLFGLFAYNEHVGPLFWVGITFVVAGLILTQVGGER